MNYEYTFRYLRDVTNVLADAKEILNEYGQITLADMKALCGLEVNNSYDELLGWTESTFTTSIEFYERPGFIIVRMPAPGRLSVIKNSSGSKTANINYVKPPENHIVIDFDIPDKDGNKSFHSMNCKRYSSLDKNMSETGLSVIDVVEAFTFDLYGIEATDTGNILKHACNWNKKHGVEDLKAVIWYATHLIDHLEKLEEENM